MSLYDEHKYSFAIAYAVYAGAHVSLSDLERFGSVDCSRKTYSKVFNDADKRNEMVGTLLTEVEGYEDQLEESQVFDDITALLDDIGGDSEGKDVKSILNAIGVSLPGEDDDVDDVDDDPSEHVDVAYEEEDEPAQEQVEYIVTRETITLTRGNETRTIKKSMGVFDDVRDLILEDDLEGAWSSASPKESLMKATAGFITIEGNQVLFQGVPLKNEMANRVISLVTRHGSKYVGHLANFASRCMENTSFRAINELLSFMEKNTLPITADGCFLTYKKVNPKYMDIHSTSVCNMPWDVYTKSFNGSKLEYPVLLKGGKNDEVTTIYTEDGCAIVSTDRRNVDDNYNQTCSNGLHVCGYSYLGHFGSHESGTDKILVCKVDPKNVVSVPRDYNDQKMRVCEYEIVGTILPGSQVKDMFVD